jgi:ankyrin repeat protein
MLKRFVGGVLLCSSFFAGSLFAQTPDKVDFGRDVLPLLRQNCIGCHGPTQQMNAFRLDRRSAALHGGTQTVLIPGSSASSRLYHRLIGNQFGNQMPPSGPLPSEQVTVIKAWIDQGADWPDTYANEVDLPPADAYAIRLIDAVRTGDSATVQKMIAADPKILNARGPGGTTPFMAATLYNDAAALKILLDKGADPNRKNDANATPLMWAVDDLAKTRLLVEHGAEVNVTSSDGRSPIFIAATQARSAPVVKYLLEHGADPNPAGRSNADSTPLRQAAIVADAEVMQLLIDHGADIAASGAAALINSVLLKCSKCFDLIAGKMPRAAYSVTLLNTAVAGNVEASRFMLDHGADINARDPQGRTALIFAASSDLLPLNEVKFLIEKGADINAKTVDGRTALHYAKLHGNTSITELLTKAGAQPGPSAGEKVLKTVSGNTADAAVRRSLPNLQKADVNFTRKSGCVSCHNDSLTAMAVSAARLSLISVDEAMSSQQVKANMSNLNELRERLLQGIAPGNNAGPGILSYVLVGLQAEKYKPDFTTDIVARFIRSRQQADGHWALPEATSRPPLCNGPITATAQGMRALQAYAPVTAKKEYDAAAELAGKWLLTAPVNNNEDRAFRLMGLVWARQDKATIQKAQRDLIATQRPDGGWAAIPSVESEAYSTGQALVALHESGVAATDAAYQKGVQFLLKTQLEDGSWYMQTRAVPIQPYFDDGFPHGVDQWISAAGTNWSTMALSFAAKTKATTSQAAGKRRR